ncbi:MAG: hypothetical protein ACXWAT_00925 [Methylobacter sp.]
MKADTVLKLGDFEFSRFEIPEKIGFGGDQALVIHNLVGGARIIDAMGRQNKPLEWSGLFYGETALERARYLDRLRVAGQKLELTWSEFRYSVVIRSFNPDFERFYKIPYSISLEVVEDLTQPVKTIVSSGIDYWIADDMNRAAAFGALIGDGPLSSLLGALDTTISTVSDFAHAAQSTINAVLAPIQAVNQRVQILIGSTGNTISNVTTLGGILPNNSISQQASSLLSQVSAMNSLPALYNLQSTMGRMTSNLGSIGATGHQVTVAGGNLFDMAANAYGDASQWVTIAAANAMSDPVISGTQTLNIPTNPGTSGGVLNG